MVTVVESCRWELIESVKNRFEITWNFSQSEKESVKLNNFFYSKKKKKNNKNPRKKSKNHTALKWPVTKWINRVNLTFRCHNASRHQYLLKRNDCLALDHQIHRMMC